MQLDNMSARQIWLYDDSMVIGPLATIWLEDGTKVDVWNEVLQTGMSLIIGVPTEHKITLKPEVWTAIVSWATANQFGGMPLHSYLNRMLATCPSALQDPD